MISDEELRNKADGLAVDSRIDSLSCVALAERIETTLKLVRDQAFKEGRDVGLREAAEIAAQHGVPEGSGVMWKACGGEINKNILSLLTPQPSEDK